MTQIELNEKWNIIPIKLDSKQPMVKWKDYQKKVFPRGQLVYYEPCNYGVICGKTSNNLVIIDFDFEGSRNFKNIFKILEVHFPEIKNTYISGTPHGLHIYLYIDGDCPNRQTQLKSPFEEIKAIDILGEGGYALTSPSIIDDKGYLPIIDGEPSTVSRKTFDKLIKFYTKKEEEEVARPRTNLALYKLRKPFKDILEGKIDIEKLAQETNMKEHVYWKYTFLEAMNTGVIQKPQQLYPLLRANQPAFDVEKTEQQLPHHVQPNMRPLTTAKLRLYFPNHIVEDPLEDWVVIAQQLQEKFDIITIADTKQIMVRRGNIYTTDTAEFFETLSKMLIKETGGKSYKAKRESILTWLKDRTQFDRDKFCYKRWIINFPNGYYDVKGKKFISASEDLSKIFFYEIPYEYKGVKHYDCPKFKKLLEEWLGKNNVVKIEDIFEMIGYSMTMNTDMKLAFFIYGEAHSGKSSFQNILATLIGDINTAATEIQRLNKDQFGTDELQFKILNMIGDMSDKIVNDVSAFKMITGGDIYIPAEHKGGKKYRFKNTVKVWYNGNYLPQVKNTHDEAFFERWILINFPNRFPVDTDDSIKAIWEMIIDDEDEVQGIIHHAIQGAIRLAQRNFFRPELRKNTKHVWRYLSDDVYAFLYDKCKRGEDETISATEFHDEFNRYLYKRKKPPLSAYKIRMMLEAYGVFKIRSGSDDRAEYYNGIGWKPEPKVVYKKDW